MPKFKGGSLQNAQNNSQNHLQNNTRNSADLYRNSKDEDEQLYSS